MAIRMTVKQIREILLNSIKIAKDSLRERPDNEFLKGRLATLVDIYNMTFNNWDKRVKKWRCKICGREEEGVLKPLFKSWNTPYWHECEFEEVEDEV